MVCQLLPLQLKIEGLRSVTGSTAIAARPDGAQGCLGHRPRLTGARLDKQQLFLNTHATNSHCHNLPASAAPIPLRGVL